MSRDLVIDHGRRGSMMQLGSCGRMGAPSRAQPEGRGAPRFSKNSGAPEGSGGPSCACGLDSLVEYARERSTGWNVESEEGGCNGS